MVRLWIGGPPQPHPVLAGHALHQLRQRAAAQAGVHAQAQLRILLQQRVLRILQLHQLAPLRAVPAPCFRFFDPDGCGPRSSCHFLCIKISLHMYSCRSKWPASAGVQTLCTKKAFSGGKQVAGASWVLLCTGLVCCHARGCSAPSWRPCRPRPCSPCATRPGLPAACPRSAAAGRPPCAHAPAVGQGGARAL